MNRTPLGQLWGCGLAVVAALLLTAVLGARVADELWGDADEMTGRFPKSLVGCIESLGVAFVHVPPEQVVWVRQGDVWRITNTCA